MEHLEMITLALIPGFIVLDLIWQSRKQQKARFYRTRALLVTLGIFYFTGYVAQFWNWALGGASLFNGAALGIAGGAVLGILVYELGHYWYHRKAHEWNWLWFSGHQMHHSAETLDTFGAYYLHPFDAFIFTSIASVVLFPVLGLSAEAGIIVALFLTFNAMFQHANIKTPRWLGYIIQRPESHAVHHGRGVHRYNYSDLPLWDLVFGTFRNPRTYENDQAGFYDGASGRIWEMLIGRDVSKPRQQSDTDAVLELSKAA